MIRDAEVDRSRVAAQAPALAPPSERLHAWSRADSLALTIITAFGTGFPLALAAATGSLAIPHFDAWAYTRVAETLFHTHHIVSVGWGVSLYGQIVAVQVLLEITRNSNWAFGLFGALCGAICLISSYCVARRLLPTNRSVIVAICVALGPSFLALETTFMTDVPALAAGMLCLATGVAALDRTGRSRWQWLTFSMFAGIFGFSIREIAIVAPVAVLAALFAKSPHSWKPLLAVGISTLAICLGIVEWAQRVPGPHQASRWEPSWEMEIGVAKLLGITVALAVLPASIRVIVTSRRLLLRVLPLVLIGAVILLALNGIDPRSPLVNGTPFGLSGVLMIGSAPVLFPAPLWASIEWAAWASLLCALVAVFFSPWRERRPITFSRVQTWLGGPKGLLGMSILGSSAFLMLTSGFGMWDRYCWPVVGPVAILILLREGFSQGHTARRGGTPILGVVVVGLALVQLALASNADAFGSARWRAGVALTDFGIAPQRIDTGLEWFAYHQPGPVSPGGPPGYVLYAWYEWLFAYPPLCGIASTSAATIVSFSPVGSISYRQLAVGGTVEHIYLFKAKNLLTCATTPG